MDVVHVEFFFLQLIGPRFSADVLIKTVKLETCGLIKVWQITCLYINLLIH